MKSEFLSPLERAVLIAVFEQHLASLIHIVDSIKVMSRSNTGAGRIVGIQSDALLPCSDGYLDMGGKFIKMNGHPAGMMGVVSVVNSKLDQLEIAVYGNGSWDGTEKDWEIV